MQAEKSYGYMRRFSIKEIIDKITGEYVKVEKPRVVPVSSIENIYQSNILANATKVSQLPNSTQQTNSQTRYFGTFTPVDYNATRPLYRLSEALEKMKETLRVIKENTIKNDPQSREAKMPLTTPILKLAVIEDIQDTGVVNEDIFVRILKEAFFDFHEAEIYKLVAFGRKGDPKLRQIDYLIMLRTWEEFFQKGLPASLTNT